MASAWPPSLPVCPCYGVPISLRLSHRSQRVPCPARVPPKSPECLSIIPGMSPPLWKVLQYPMVSHWDVPGVSLVPLGWSPRWPPFPLGAPHHSQAVPSDITCPPGVSPIPLRWSQGYPPSPSGGPQCVPHPLWTSPVPPGLFPRYPLSPVDVPRPPPAGQLQPVHGDGVHPGGGDVLPPPPHRPLQVSRRLGGPEGVPGEGQRGPTGSLGRPWGLLEGSVEGLGMVGVPGRVLGALRGPKNGVGEL